MGRPPVHGLSKTPTWESWEAMMQRCYNPKVNRWKYYGGKGIKVCDAWHNFDNFFWAMGERPKGSTLDRIDRNKDYSPSNCRWSTPYIQAINRSSTHWITAKGKTRTLTDWARRLNIQPSAIRWRIANGWGEEQAVTFTPRRDIRRNQRRKPI